MKRYRANDPEMSSDRWTWNAIVAVVVGFGLAFTAATSPACSASQKATESADLHAALNCAEAAVLPILAQVTTIIVTGGVGWEAALDEIGKTAGDLSLACAIKTVDTVISAPTPTPKTGLDPAYARASGIIAARGWTFK